MLFTTSPSSEIGAEIKAKAAAIIPVLRKNAYECDTLGKLNDEVIRAMGDAGIWKMTVPKEFGGHAPLPTRDIYDIMVEIGKGNTSAAWCTAVNMFGHFSVEPFSEKTLKEFYDPAHVGPYACGSSFNLSYADGEAREVEGGYMVKGDWAFASTVRNCAWLIGGAFVRGADGTPIDRVSAMIPRSQYKVADDWNVIGMRATNSNTAYVEEEVFVPRHRVASIDTGLKEAQERSVDLDAAESPFAVVAVMFGAIAVGAAYGALDVFLERAAKRKPWSQAYPTILAMPSTQVTLAKVRAQISFCEAAILRTMDRGPSGEVQRPSGPLSGPAETLYTAAYAIDALRDAICDLQDIMGASTAALTDPLGRFAADIRVLCLHGALRLTWMSEAYGRQLAGLPAAENRNADSGERRPRAPELVDA